jgi:hypothetical protein
VNYLAVALDSFSVKDIWEDCEEDVCKIPDLMKQCRETGIAI